MADNVTIPATGSGTATPVVATDDVSGVHYQYVKLVDGTADGSGKIAGDATNGLDVDVTRLSTEIVDNAGFTDGATKLVPAGFIFDEAAGTALTENDAAAGRIDSKRAVVVAIEDVSTRGRRLVINSDGSINTTPSGTALTPVSGAFATCSTDITRPSNATQYAVDDALADTTPTTGGFTFTGAARSNGGSGIITDMIITSDADAATKLQGEIFIFDRAVTAIADNAAFAVSDAEIKTCVGKVPFTLEDSGNNGFYHAQNLNIGFTCNGSANLRFLVRVKNTYTPVSGEVITVVAKALQVN